MDMRNQKYVWVIAAFICIAVGLFVIGIAFIAAGFHITGFSSVEYEQKLTPITEKFDRIVVDGGDCEVNVLHLNARHSMPQYQELEIDGPTVVSYDAENLTTEVRVEDGTLYITRRNMQPWYAFIGVDIGNNGIAVMLDDYKLESVDIDADKTKITTSAIIPSDRPLNIVGIIESKPFAAMSTWSENNLPKPPKK